MAKTDFRSVGEYLATQPDDVQPILRKVRDAIRKALPVPRKSSALIERIAKFLAKESGRTRKGEARQVSKAQQMSAAQLHAVRRTALRS